VSKSAYDAPPYTQRLVILSLAMDCSSCREQILKKQQAMLVLETESEDSLAVPRQRISRLAIRALGMAQENGNRIQEGVKIALCFSSPHSHSSWLSSLLCVACDCL
jgi:hypothetical protein